MKSNRNVIVHIAMTVAVAFFATISTAAGATTYSYSSPNYSADGIAHGKISYTPAMKISGSFATAEPLPANLSKERIDPGGSDRIKMWNFSDGLHNYTPANSTLHVGITTDSVGNVIHFVFVVASPKAPYVVGQRVNVIAVWNDAKPSAQVFSDAICKTDIDGFGGPDLDSDSTTSDASVDPPIGTVTISSSPESPGERKLTKPPQKKAR